MLSYFVGSLAIFICLISCVLTVASTPSSLTPSVIVLKTNLLQKSPALLKEDGSPLGTVGVLLYTYINGIPYILLAREAKGKDKGTYCEFGGSLDLNTDGQPETFLEGCIRECKEESAGLYVLSPEALLKSKYYYETTPKRREIILCLVETNNIYQTVDLLKAQTKYQDEHFKEKDQLQWVKVSDLLAFNTLDLPLRPFFKDIIKQPEFQNLLQNLRPLQKAA